MVPMKFDTSVKAEVVTLGAVGTAAMDLPTLASVLQRALSTNPEERKAGEEQLNQFQHAPGHLVGLLQIIVANNVDLSIREIASIFFKNVIARDWTPRDPGDLQKISGIDKTTVRVNLLEAIIYAPPLIRVQLGECLKTVIHADYPDQWPFLLSAIDVNLKSRDQQRVYGALYSLRILTRKYEFKDEGERTPVYVIINTTFPVLLEILKYLLLHQNPPIEIADLIKLICKIFWSSSYLEIPKLLHDPSMFTAWMACYHNLLERPVPTEGQPADLEQRKVWGWWKVKKWTLHIMHRLYNRFGDPKMSKPEHKAFAQMFQKQFAGKFLESCMTLLGVLCQGGYLPDRVINLGLQYLITSVSKPVTYQLLRPQLDIVLFEIIFPLLCFNDNDEQLWRDDPHGYVRKGYDITEDMYSPRTAAINFVSELVRKRGKENFQKFLSFVVEVFRRYDAAPVGQKLYRQKDGGLLAVGALSEKLKRTQPYKSQLEHTLVQHVYPEFLSPVGHLRAKAAWVAGKYADVTFSDQHNFTSAMHSVVSALKDPELPVRVVSVVALRSFVDSCKDLNEIQPMLPGLLDEFYKLMNEVEIEDLVFTLETIVGKFGEEMSPYSLGLCQNLAAALWKCLQSAEMDEDEDDSGASATVDCLRALGTILESPFEGSLKAAMREVHRERMEAVIHSLQEGDMDFSKAAITRAVRNLLNMYGRNDGWTYIEENDYQIVIEWITSEKNQKKTKAQMKSGGVPKKKSGTDLSKAVAEPVVERLPVMCIEQEEDDCSSSPGRAPDSPDIRNHQRRLWSSRCGLPNLPCFQEVDETDSGPDIDSDNYCSTELGVRANNFESNGGLLEYSYRNECRLTNTDLPNNLSGVDSQVKVLGERPRQGAQTEISSQAENPSGHRETKFRCKEETCETDVTALASGSWGQITSYEGTGIHRVAIAAADKHIFLGESSQGLASRATNALQAVRKSPQHTDGEEMCHDLLESSSLITFERYLTKKKRTNPFSKQRKPFDTTVDSLQGICGVVQASGTKLSQVANNIVLKETPFTMESHDNPRVGKQDGSNLVVTDDSLFRKDGVSAENATCVTGLLGPKNSSDLRMKSVPESDQSWKALQVLGSNVPKYYADKSTSHTSDPLSEATLRRPDKLSGISEINDVHRNGMASSAILCDRDQNQVLPLSQVIPDGRKDVSGNEDHLQVSGAGAPVLAHDGDPADQVPFSCPRQLQRQSEEDTHFVTPFLVNESTVPNTKVESVGGREKNQVPANQSTSQIPPRFEGNLCRLISDQDSSPGRNISCGKGKSESATASQNLPAIGKASSVDAGSETTACSSNGREEVFRNGSHAGSDKVATGGREPEDGGVVASTTIDASILSQAFTLGTPITVAPWPASYLPPPDSSVGHCQSPQEGADVSANRVLTVPTTLACSPRQSLQKNKSGLILTGHEDMAQTALSPSIPGNRRKSPSDAGNRGILPTPHPLGPAFQAQEVGARHVVVPYFDVSAGHGVSGSVTQLPVISPAPWLRGSAAEHTLINSNKQKGGECSSVSTPVTAVNESKRPTLSDGKGSGYNADNTTACGSLRRMADQTRSLYVGNIPKVSNVDESLTEVLWEYLNSFEFIPSKIARLEQVYSHERAYGYFAFAEFSTPKVAMIVLDACQADPEALVMRGQSLKVKNHSRAPPRDGSPSKDIVFSSKAPSLAPVKTIYVGHIPPKWWKRRILLSYFSSILKGSDALHKSDLITEVYLLPSKSEAYLELASEALADALIYKCTKDPKVLGAMSDITFICRHPKFIPLSAALCLKRCGAASNPDGVNCYQATLYAEKLSAGFDGSYMKRVGDLLKSVLGTLRIEKQLDGSIKVFSLAPDNSYIYIVFNSEAVADAVMDQYIDKLQTFCMKDMSFCFFRHHKYIRPGALYRNGEGRLRGLTNHSNQPQERKIPSEMDEVHAHVAGSIYKKSDKPEKVHSVGITGSTTVTGTNDGDNATVCVKGLPVGLLQTPLEGVLNELFERALSQSGLLEPHKRVVKACHHVAASSQASVWLYSPQMAEALVAYHTPLKLGGERLTLVRASTPNGDNSFRINPSGTPCTTYCSDAPQNTRHTASSPIPRLMDSWHTPTAIFDSLCASPSTGLPSLPQYPLASRPNYGRPPTPTGSSRLPVRTNQPYHGIPYFSGLAENRESERSRSTSEASKHHSKRSRQEEPLQPDQQLNKKPRIKDDVKMNKNSGGWLEDEGDDEGQNLMSESEVSQDKARTWPKGSDRTLHLGVSHPLACATSHTDPRRQGKLGYGGKSSHEHQVENASKEKSTEISICSNVVNPIVDPAIRQLCGVCQTQACEKSKDRGSVVKEQEKNKLQAAVVLIPTDLNGSELDSGGVNMNSSVKQGDLKRSRRVDEEHYSKAKPDSRHHGDKQVDTAKKTLDEPCNLTGTKSPLRQRRILMFDLNEPLVMGSPDGPFSGHCNAGSGSLLHEDGEVSDPGPVSEEKIGHQVDSLDVRSSMSIQLDPITASRQHLPSGRRNESRKSPSMENRRSFSSRDRRHDRRYSEADDGRLYRDNKYRSDRDTRHRSDRDDRHRSGSNVDKYKLSERMSKYRRSNSFSQGADERKHYRR